MLWGSQGTSDLRIFGIQMPNSEIRPKRPLVQALIDGRLNLCTFLHDNCIVSVPTPCNFRKVIVLALCDLYREVVKITR